MNYYVIQIASVRSVIGIISTQIEDVSLIDQSKIGAEIVFMYHLFMYHHLQDSPDK